MDKEEIYNKLVKLANKYSREMNYLNKNGSHYCNAYRAEFCTCKRVRADILSLAHDVLFSIYSDDILKEQANEHERV